MRMLVSRVRDAASCDAEVELAFESRARFRLILRTTANEEIGVVLERGGEPLDEGDVLVAADGYRVRVRAKPERLLEVASPDPLVLARAAYHLGNRHVRVELGPGRLRLGEDAVLEAMLARLGAPVVHVEAAFRPEHGAYGGGGHHSHGGDATFARAPRIHDFVGRGR